MPQKPLLASMVLAALALPPAFARAAEAVVPATAIWAAHADLEGLHQSKIGQEIQQRIAGVREIQAGLDAIKNLSGVDLRKDLRSITVYGAAPGELNNVAILRGNFEPDKLLTIIRMNPTYKEMDVAGRKVYQWRDEAPPPFADTEGMGHKHAPKHKFEVTHFGTFVGEHTIVIADKEALLKDVVALPEIEDTSVAVALGHSKFQPSEGALVGIYVNELPPPPPHAPEAALLAKFASARAELGEHDGRMFVRVAVDAKDRATADDLAAMARGGLAFLDLVKDAQEKDKPVLPAEAKSILNDVQVSAEGTTARLAVDTPLENVVGLVDWAIEQGKLMKSGK